MTVLDNKADSQPTRASDLPVLALGSSILCKLRRYAFPGRVNARLNAQVNVSDFLWKY